MPLPILPSAPQPADKTTGQFNPKTAAWIGALPAWTDAANALELTFTASNLAGTSLTSNAIGTGSKTFTASTGKGWAAGTWLLVSDTSNAGNYMVGTVTSYVSGTGALTVNVQATGGSGTLASWSITITAPLSPAPTLTSLNGSHLAGLRNVIVNADMRIDQRNSGAAQTITAGAALAYTVDRWYAACTGANVTGQRVAGTGSDLFAYRFTGAASVSGITFGTRLEAASTAHLAGTTASLSVVLANSLLSTVSWAAYYATTTDSFGTIAAPTRTLIASGSFTVTGTATRYQAQLAIPGAATTGIEIVFSVGAQTSGTWTIDNVQLEPGGAATPIERRPLPLELVQCQRFFVQEAFTVVRYGPAAGTWASMIYLPVTMRATPSVALSNLTYSAAAGATTSSIANRSFLLNATTTGATEFSASGTYAATAEL